MIRAGGAPAGSRYADQRHYIVPASLAELRGPVSGTVTLDRRLDWSGDASYDLDDPGDLQVMYQTVLNQGATVADLRQWLDGDTLRRLWPDLWLPARPSGVLPGPLPRAGRATAGTGRLSVEPVHLRLAEIGLPVAGRYGFALAGGRGRSSRI